MKPDQIAVFEQETVFYVGTASEQIQISDALAVKLTGKNQAEICGILRRDPEITSENLAIIERWCEAIHR